LIQVAATGFEMMKGFESYQEDADLPFYEPGEDGITKAQKVKIAFSSKWKPLLNLDYKGEKIETIDRLNQAIKDESWMSKNKDFVTLTAVRIPVQGLNSMEFMEVFHFLPESMGNVIVVSPALVAKSGGDFDIDKLTTFFPNIFNNKYTGKVKLYNSKDLKIKDSNLSKEIKDIVKPSKEKLKALTKIRQELSSEMSAYKSQKEGIKATKDEIKLSLRKLDVEIALYNEQLDLLEEVEFALTNPDDITTISNLVAETLGENALVEATQSAIEQTKNTIKTKINEGITNQQFLLKAINTSLKELNEDLNYTRLEINNINKAINPVKEFLGKMQELVYESSAKKAYENEVISIIREVLSHPDNFAQLVRPNDTDLLNNEEYGSTWFKANSKEKKDKTWTGVVDFSEIKKQFLSNLVGKASLGIAAVNNTFFALSQRAGLYLNDNYTTFQGAKQKPILNKTRINLPHNTVNIGGKELPSLSNKFAKNQNYQISDVISQFINGFVDVANDDWVFFINAVKEYTPTMLFLNQLGVDAKTNIAFFNQPILKEYLASVQKKKNLFNRLRNPELYTFAANRSVEEILLEAENIKDEKLQQLIDKLRVKKADPIGFTFFEYQAILNYLQDKAEQNKDVFSLENLSKSVYDNTPLTTEENLMILAHYLELKKMGDTVTTLQRGLNADTKKVGSSYAVQERQSLIEQAKKSKLFPEDIVSKMRNSSAISAFTNEETGFDKFSKDLFEDLFELTGNDVINSTLKELTSKDPDLKFEYKSSESSKLISTFKNDFISYIYQKNVYEGNTLVSKLIEPLFNPKSSLAKKLQQLKTTYPELAKEFPILDILTPDILRVNGREIKSNLKFKHNLSNRDEINNAVQNIRQLLSFNNPSYSKENQLEIQEFTKKLVKFAIIQSGLNNSVFNIMSMIPNEEYTKDLTKAVKESIDVFKNKSLDAKKAIEKFYNQSFKEQNPSFFTKLADEEGYVKGNKNPERGKIFTNKGLETETSELVKLNKKQQFIDSIPSVTSTYDTNVAAALKENKDTLLIIEDNTLKSKTNPLEKDKAFIGTIFTKNDSKQPLSDEDFIKNQELIDRAIELIIDKSYDKVNLKGIKFPEQGVGQDLLTASPETFNYLSKRLKDSFGYNNLNFTENSTQEVIEQQIQNKEGIDFVFEQTPELANQVYEALGFDKTLEFYEGDNLKIDDKTYTISEKISSKELAKRNGLTISSNVPVYIVNEPLGLRKGGYDTVNNIIILSKNSDKETIHHELIHSVEYNLDKKEIEPLYQKVKNTITEDSFNDFVSWNFKKSISEFIADALSKKVFRDALKKEGLLEEIDNILSVYNQQITPQQKQQALQLYSQYLESLNKPNTNPILQGNQQEQVKKFAELQERLNNKEFVGGAKNAFESSEELQQFGTQEQYNDYIARVSLGIIKNPSSGEYNYYSKVKDIVYRGAEKGIENHRAYSHWTLRKSLAENFVKQGVNLNKKDESQNTLYFALLNIKNLVRAIEITDKSLKEQGFDSAASFPNQQKPDGSYYDNEEANESIQLINKNLNNEITVFEPEQIHILGSKQDIEGFKKFVEQPINKEIKPKIDSSKKISAKGKMTFSYGGNKRSGVTSTTTFEAIKNGERTATTRYESDGHIDYWKNLKEGDIIEWESANGEKVLVEVTKPLHKLVGSGKTAEQWSKLEGWSVDYFNSKVKPKLDGAWQIEYKTLTQEQPITEETKEELPGLDNLPDPQCK
jgi:hypothetical protein